MALSLTPEIWEKLTDLKERRERLERELRRTRGLVAEGQATQEDVERVERQSRAAEAAWSRLRIEGLGERTIDPDDEVEGVPRDR